MTFDEQERALVLLDQRIARLRRQVSFHESRGEISQDLTWIRKDRWLKVKLREAEEQYYACAQTPLT